jgi:hypothetical protein
MSDHRSQIIIINLARATTIIGINTARRISEIANLRKRSMARHIDRRGLRLTGT